MADTTLFLSFGEVARRSGVPVETVIERVGALLAAGTIRRVRQTLLSTNLADGALVAWQLPQERLYEAFDFMFQRDPRSEEHTSELQSLMRISYAVFCLKKNKQCCHKNT